MDSNLVGLLIQVAAAEAPAIIAAVRNAGGTVQNVGPILDQAAVIIDGDIQQLKDEQAAPPTP